MEIKRNENLLVVIKGVIALCFILMAMAFIFQPNSNLKNNTPSNNLINDDEEILLGDECSPKYVLSSSDSMGNIPLTTCKSYNEGSRSSGSTKVIECTGPAINGAGGNLVTCTCYTYYKSGVTCTKCDAGKELNSNKQCVACSKGYHSSDGTKCEACDKGTYQDKTGQQFCTKCPAGYYQDKTGQSGCKSCDGYVNDARTTCTPRVTSCNAGYFLQNNECKPCPSSQTGRMTCAGGTAAPVYVSCSEGYYLSNGSCKACPSGQVCEGGTAQPACGAGYYLDITQYADGTSSSTCKKCDKGSYKDKTGNEACTVCKPGYYTDEEGQTECQKVTGANEYASAGLRYTCDNGTVDSGHTSCTCKAGFWNNTGDTNVRGEVTCVSCDNGYYKDHAGNDECKVCNGMVTGNGTGCNETVGCYCKPTGGNCSWGPAASGYILQSNITNSIECSQYSGEAGCFRNSSGKYVWGSYGNTSGYTHADFFTPETCDRANSEEHVLSLTCPSSYLTIGQTTACTGGGDYSNKDNVSMVSSNSSVVSVSGLSATGKKVGTATVRLYDSGYKIYSNSVTITVLESGNDASNCDITGVSVNQSIVSLSGDSYSANSYYIVQVGVAGLGCNKNSLSLSATNAKSVSPSTVNITTSERSSSYSFHVYPNECGTSVPTAKLSNGKSSTGNGVTVLGDWQKTTGCFTPCGSSRCTSGEYNSALAADLDNSETGPYYSAWDATKRCYGEKWTRGGCGGGSSGSNPTPTPTPTGSTPTPTGSTPPTGVTPTPGTPTTQTYSYCCIKNDGSDYAWYSNQTSKTCPSGYTLDPNKTEPTCVKPVSVPHCYEKEDGEYIWTSTPEASWLLISGITKEKDCHKEETPACYKDSDGHYVWGPYAQSDGYTYISSITSEEVCHDPTPDSNEACYKNDQGDYTWASSQPTGYTLVEGVTSAEDCHKEETPACYYHESEYVWGNYENVNGYILVDEITEESACHKPKTDACYVGPNGEHVWGVYDENPDYTLVPSITEMSECNDAVPVPSTGMSISKIMYIFMAILMAAGIGFIYYSAMKKKTN